MKTVDVVAAILVVAGAVSWGLVGAARTDLAWIPTGPDPANKTTGRNGHVMRP